MINRKYIHKDHRLIAELIRNPSWDHLILEDEIPKHDVEMGQPTMFVTLELDVYRRKAS